MRGEGSLAPGLGQFPGKKGPLGIRLCPTCWGRCWDADRAAKRSESKDLRGLVFLAVGSEIRFPALPWSESGGVCHLPVSLIKIGGPFLFIVDLAKGGDSLDIYREIAA